ncbi:MAG TPA: S8 family serine peptidase, partial [Micromonospora sp.]
MTTRARPRRWRALVGSAVAVVLVATLSPANPAAAVPLPDDGGGSKLTAELTTRFDRAAGAPQDFVIQFGARADLSAAPGIRDWVARGEYVVKELQRVAAREQATVTDLLKQQRVTHRSFWISNTIHVTGGSRPLAEQLAARPEVAKLLEPVVLAQPNPRITVEADDPIQIQAVEWGLQNINADDVWAQGVEGSGIVIANIDSGVQFDHPTLVNQYRGNLGNGAFNHDYNWFDGSGHCDGAPCDTNGHGTHTMGTMIGDDGGANQIGVAPGARWITANGCEPCTTSNLLASAQWMLAPTRVDGTDPDPAMRPHIVNNSWGTTSPSSAPYMTEIWL